MRGHPVLLALVILLCEVPASAQVDPAESVSEIDPTPTSDSDVDSEGRGFFEHILSIPGDLSDFFDRVHDSVSQQLIGRTEDLDEFFGDDRLEDDPRIAMVRLRLQGTWEERGKFPTRVRVRARLPFPRTERRLQLVLDSLGGEEDVEEEEPAFEEEQDEDSFAGLRFAPILGERTAISLDAGVRIRSGIEARGEVRFQRDFSFYEFNGRFLEGFFWREDDGFGERTRLDLEHQLGVFGVARLRNEGEWSEVSRGVELEHSFTVSRPLDERTALTLALGAELHTRPSWIVDSWSAELKLRRQLHRRWLFAEVVPGAGFPRDRRYEFTPSLRLVLEIRFGGELAPLEELGVDDPALPVPLPADQGTRS